MTDTVGATLCIEVWVDCPHCDNYINILDDKGTDGEDLDEKSYVTSRIFDCSWVDFEVEDVTCSECKTTFNINGLDW